MSSTSALPELERRVRALADLPESRAVTTCYLDVDGRHRPRTSDYLDAFNVLAQGALHDVAGEDADVAASVRHDVAMMRRWLERDFDRSHVRGVALVARSFDGAFHAVELHVPVRDQISVGRRAQLMQLETVCAEARRFAVALVDHERLRLLEFRLGDLVEYPAAIDLPQPHRDRQRGWSVTGSTAATGHDAAHWQPAGAHVDRRELNLEERHIGFCVAALGRHLARHPADHLLVGGPEPLRTRLERGLPERLRHLVIGRVPVRVTAPLAEIRDAVLEAAREAEEHEEDAILARLDEASARGRAVTGAAPVAAALAEGRVADLVVALTPAGADAEAAVGAAAGAGARRHFIRHNTMPPSTGGIAAILRF